MFFDDDQEEVFLNNPDLYHIVSRQLFGLGASFDPIPHNFNMVRDVPTHTEDGIPIRKLYVSNLPPKTTRSELFGMFAQYGFIKSCWIRMGERGPGKSPTPTYAFITYSDPADAHKALLAQNNEKYLRGRHLRISPADSWHQPIQNPDGSVPWKSTYNNYASQPVEEGEASGGTDNAEYSEQGLENTDTPPATETEATEEIHEEEPYGILDILNRDCLDHILSYVPILDIIRTESVSKRWQSMTSEHLQSRRTLRTVWWERGARALTTAVLRRALQKVGGALTRLHIDHRWPALNDRTAHIVGKFCPNLEEFKVFGMHTKNWNPLIYGCKSLKTIKFVSCNKLTDSSLVQLVKNHSITESLTVANNTHVTGLFLSGASPPKLNSLSFYNCSSLQGSVVCTALDFVPNITTLRLDMCPVSVWIIIPGILNKLPRLEILSLSEYRSMDTLPMRTKELCDALGKLSELKVLNVSKNVYINDAVLKQVANSCPKLESLNISSCNPTKIYSAVSDQTMPLTGVSDESIEQICSQCKHLNWLDVSYLAGLSDRGLAAVTALPALRTLVSRGNAALTAHPFVACLSACTQLQEVDASGCDSVSQEVLSAAVVALEEAPRRLALHLAGTAAALSEDILEHKYLTVNIEEDLSNPNLRPDFVDETFAVSSDGSLEDFYNGFLDDDDDLFMDSEEDFEDFDFDGVLYGLHGRNIILL